MRFKVAFISSYFPPVTVGGVEKYLLYLCEELSKQDIECAVLTKHYPLLAKREIVANVQTYRVGLNPFIYSTRRYIGPLAWTLGNLLTLQSLGRVEARGIVRGTDILHSQLGTANDVWFGRYLSTKTGIPHIVTVHGRFGSGPEDLKVSSSLLNQLAKAEHVIVNRRVSQEFLKSHGVSSITVLENPIPVSSYLRPQRLLGQTIKRAKRVLFVGRLTHRRGAHLAVEGFAYAASHLPELEMWLVGYGSLLRELRLFVKKEHLEERVRFFGKQSRTEPFFWQSDIFLATSPIANSPSLSLREAMAAGLAIIATDVEHTSRIVTDSETGLLVPTSSKEIGKAIVRLVEDESKFRRTRERAANYARETFDIKSYVTRLIAIYESHLGRERNPIE